MSEEEEEEENMTGPDYQYVISTAQGAEAHFKFKSEQEWEAAAGLAPSGFSEFYPPHDLCRKSG